MSPTPDRQDLRPLLRDSYRVVHLPTVRDITVAGFDLLPSFRRPHFTVRLDDAESDTLRQLLGALGPARPNPYHGLKRPGRS
ncbi:MAG: hypothetical protein WKF43_01255 [Acidimicrobiales bacterium]